VTTKSRKYVRTTKVKRLHPLVYEVHAYEMHACEMYAHEVHAHGVHANEMHGS
jgi:hypothetical protein